MVSETRSGRQIRNEVNNNILKEKVKIGKDARSSSLQKGETSGVRKSGNETALSGQTTPSPQSTTKPKRLEKEIPLTPPCATRKSERLEKHSTPSSLKRLDRSKRKLSPSLERKQPSEELSFPVEKRQKEKNLSQVVMESAKAQVHSESVPKKKTKMNLRKYMNKYKVQQLQEILDTDDEFEESDTLSVNPTVTGNVVDGPPELPDGDAFGDSQASSNVKETFNSSEGLPKNCCPTSVDSPISESSTCLARLQDDAVHSESGEKCEPPKVNTLHSSGHENNSLSRACTLCCKNKRISSDLPVKELCSCDATAIMDVGSSFVCKDRGDHIAAVILESAGKFDSKNPSEKLHSDDQMPGQETVCTNSVETQSGEEKTSKRCPRLIDGSTSRFLEWWLPVELSNHQLEQYCATLLSNSIPLRSYSKIDPVGSIQKILPTVRKCCDHPYLDDLYEQGRLIDEGRPAAEILEIGIQASGKLQLLDMMLAEIKTRKLQVLILFQLILGSGKASAGDILDDFLRQRFGQHSYERIDSGITPSKKQAAVNRFNKKETDQFVLLLENRACSSTIKLLSLDTVIIYDSDWNPVNDFRALQKVSFDSKVEQIKVLRLYSTLTVEERSLLFAKQNINIDNSLQTLSRGATSDNLLMWGASNLFNRLEEYHSESISASNNSSQQLLTEVIQELQSILSESCGVTNTNSVVSTVKFDVGRYSVKTPLLGEAKVQLKEGEEPHVFWRNLLDRKIPQWKHLSAPSPRNRKRVQYFDRSPSKLDTENDDVGKKRRRVVNENVDPASVQAELGEQDAQVAGPAGGFSNVITCDQYQSLQRGSIASEKSPNCISNLGSIGAEVDALESEERVGLIKQKSLHSSLLGEMTRLCQILKLSEGATHTVKRFLEYVIKNHHVSSDSLVIMQAFQLSLCWVASSISKHKLDKKESLLLVKQLLNYQCTEEQAHSVYLKMRSLKKMYLQCAENVIDSGREGLLGEGNTSKEPSSKECGLQGASYKLQNVKKETEEKTVNEEHTEGRILSQMELARKDIGARSEIDNKIKQIEKNCSKRMKKLIRKQQEKIKVFHQIWEERRLKLEEDHKLESALIRSLHGQGPVRMDKLKRLDDNFAKKLEEHNLLKDAQFKDLEAVQVAAKNEERRKAAHWRAQAHITERRAANCPPSLDSQSEDYAGCSQSAMHAVIDSTDVISVSSQQIQDRNPNSNALARGNDMAPSNTSISDPSEPVVCDASVESQNNITSNCQNDTAMTSPKRSSYSVVEQLNQSKQSTDIVEQLNPLKQSSDTSEMDCEKMPVSGERVSYETQSGEPNEEVPICVPETIPKKNIEFTNVPNNGSDKGDAESFTDTEVDQRDCSDKITFSSLYSGGKILESSEKVVVSSDRSGLLVSQEKVQPSSMELQNKNVPVIENQCIAQIVVAPLEPFSTLSNVELRDQNGPAVENQGTSQSGNPELVDIVNPVQSIMEQQVGDAPAVTQGDAPAVTQSNVELPDQDGPAIENQGISQSANSEFVDTVNPVQSTIERQVGDAPAVENQSTSLPEVPVFGLRNAVTANTKEPESSEQVDQMSVEEPPSCNMYPAVDDAHQNSDQRRDSFPTAEVAVTQMLSHESYCQSGENSEISINPLDFRSNIPLDRIAELPVSSQNVAVTQVVADPVEVPNRTVAQLGIDTSPLLGSSYIAHPTHQGASWNLTPPLFTEPLQNELERIRKEKEHLEKNHEDMASKLKSDLENEIQQLRNKCEMKLQDAETNLRLKKNVLEQNQNKVLMNKVLAEAFKSKCLNLRPSGLPGMQQAGMPPGFMQHLHQQLSLQQPSVRVPPGASNFQPSSSQQNASPAQIAAMHHIPLPHSTRASAVAVQNVIPPAGQRVLQAPAPFSGTPSTPNSASRPPLISSITPSRNPLVGGEIRSIPPHLQPFRPPVVSQQRPPQPILPPPQHAPLVSASQPMSTSQTWVEPQIGVPSQRTTSLSAQGLLMEKDHRPRNRASSPLPEICSTFSTLEPSDLETLANVQGNHTSSSADVVCLSDDE